MNHNANDRWVARNNYDACMTIKPTTCVANDEHIRNSEVLRHIVDALGEDHIMSSYSPIIITMISDQVEKFRIYFNIMVRNVNDVNINEA